MIALVSHGVGTGDFVTILILKLASGRLHRRKLVAGRRKTPAHFPSSMSLIPLELERGNRLRPQAEAGEGSDAGPAVTPEVTRSRGFPMRPRTRS